mmetsp:Transcript_53600/g.152741  ORF Transcript_53600/g.152741 Transcript_53600/m.152741 type:complete len:577 (-) Transcript_53600:72-1802(-)
MQSLPLLSAAFLVLAQCPSADAKGFLVDKGLRSNVDAKSFQSHLRDAMGEALGCGGHVSQGQLDAIEQVLTPMWHSFPKNAGGNVERQSLRYVAHRYFSQRSSFQVRGLEPSKPRNQSGWGTDDILSRTVPSYVEGVLESQHKSAHGFNLKDAVYMVATIEQLIFDSESELLQKVYNGHRKPVTRSLTEVGLRQVLEEYLVRWMMGDDEQSVSMLLGNKTLLQDSIPHWDQIVAHSHGQVKNLQHLRERAPLDASRGSHNAMEKRFSFEDAHGIAGGISRSFASFWESECSSMKNALVKMDSHRTGRVPLSKFYSSALDSEWRFGESEAYLRDLGALDETSSWQGKQVIIPNYIQAASNCIVQTPHYLVCCRNECDGLLGEIEAKVGKPAAPPAELLQLVGNMTLPSSLDSDEPPRLEGALTAQLQQIAATHGGQVPLHGRLFAQWLHFAFPRECPFPHKAGTVAAAAVTPSEYGDNFIATEDEMKKHVSSASNGQNTSVVNLEEVDWMTQWNPEEELLAGDLIEMRAPWETNHRAIGGIVFFLLCGLASAVQLGRRGHTVEPSLLPTHCTKSHFV